MKTIATLAVTLLFCCITMAQSPTAALIPNITDLFRCGAAVRVPFEVYRDCE